jgi:8-oxo-dGTP pyrophosphatase MutT (NUDIX family)
LTGWDPGRPEGPWLAEGVDVRATAPPVSQLSLIRSQWRIWRVVRLREYYCDASAPRAHDVLPAAFAAVRNSAGELLLVRRIDDGNWELPGGRIEVGESVSEAVVREVAEESGITILLIGFAGVYSDPSHVLVDPGGSIHQQLALCFHAVPAVPDAGGQPRPDGIETNAAAWCANADIADLRMHPAMRLRIDNALRVPAQPYIE